MKRKEVDDVMGGEGAWDNVDQTEGMTDNPPSPNRPPRRQAGKLGLRNIRFTDVFAFFLPPTAAQCPSEDCTGTKAYFYMVQIRSADEPMTAFFKVGVIVVQFYQMCADVYDVILVRYMWSQMEGELSVNDLEHGEEGFIMVITMVSRRNDFPDKSFFI